MADVQDSRCKEYVQKMIDFMAQIQPTGLPRFRRRIVDGHKHIESVWATDFLFPEEKKTIETTKSAKAKAKVNTDGAKDEDEDWVLVSEEIDDWIVVFDSADTY
ncbi:unnamed protein product [Discula destructiva]